MFRHNRNSYLLTGWLALFTIVLASEAMGNVWRERTPGNPPADRKDHALAYDENDRNTLLFGGFRGGGNWANDSWIWNGQNWALQGGTNPAAREDHGMAYFETGSGSPAIVMFGGWNGTTHLADTWERASSAWTQASPATSPTLRGRHVMARNVGGTTVLLFGGESGFTSLNDTWTWNGTNWTLLAPASFPLPRVDAAMVYDSVRDVVVLFGGRDALSTLYGDTWEWDGTTWTEQSPATSPSARGAHKMTYDASREVTVLFGGASSFTGSNLYLSDTWEWDGTNWTDVTSSGPSARHAHAMAYDSGREANVLFGGNTSGGVLNNETWVNLGLPDCLGNDGDYASKSETTTNLNSSSADSVTFTARLANDEGQDAGSPYWFVCSVISIVCIDDGSGSAPDCDSASMSITENMNPDGNVYSYDVAVTGIDVPMNDQIEINAEGILNSWNSIVISDVELGCPTCFAAASGAPDFGFHYPFAQITSVRPGTAHNTTYTFVNEDATASVTIENIDFYVSDQLYDAIAQWQPNGTLFHQVTSPVVLPANMGSASEHEVSLNVPAVPFAERTYIYAVGEVSYNVSGATTENFRQGHREEYSLEVPTLETWGLIAVTMGIAASALILQRRRA